ncbi:MAG: hypothetical protein IPO90_15930, partial [Flavobacteriales bacterium]|nr:hypothetical protein [Flavobacteriales bacterium]
MSARRTFWTTTTTASANWTTYCRRGWLWFYGTILWSIVFMANHYVFNIWPDQDVEYKQEMAKAKADVAAYQAQFKNSGERGKCDVVDRRGFDRCRQPGIPQSIVSLASGTGLEGKEGLGPNLTDAYWKHGGGIKNVFRNDSPRRSGKGHDGLENATETDRCSTSPATS